MSAHLLEVRDLSYRTPTGRLLQEKLSFVLKTGQMLLITGSNGCGKSTLLKALLRRFQTTEGSIRFSIEQDRIEYIPQLENTEIHFPLTLRDVLTIATRKKVCRKTVREIGLLKDEHLSIAWNTASGGERKRTLLTRALLQKPWFLVFDEPMNHLDSESRQAMIRVMARFLEGSIAEPRAIIMVCHQGLEPEEKKLFNVLSLDLDKRDWKETT